MVVRELNVSLRDYSSVLDKDIILHAVSVCFVIQPLDVLVIRETDSESKRTGAWSSFEYHGVSIANSNYYKRDTTNIVLFHKHTHSI